MNILSLNYIGNIQYFSKMLGSDWVIDIYENYRKQSFLSRCEIQTAGGRTPLIVNVRNPGNFSRTAVKDVRLDHAKRWRAAHWRSMVSAYANSPYFDFYAGHFEPLYTREYDFLFDLNAGLLETVMGLLELGKPLFSDRYIDMREYVGSARDFREAISPKPRLMVPDPQFEPRPYWQVFSDRFPFERNLSVIDLLFCEGPVAKDILAASAVEG